MEEKNEEKSRIGDVRYLSTNPIGVERDRVLVGDLPTVGTKVR